MKKKGVSKNAGKVFRPKRQINRKTKLNLVFDPEARREFLTGFHKRKLQRQKKAQEEFKIQLKEEKKKIRDEALNYHKKLIVSYRPIPGLEPEDVEEDEQAGTVLEFPEHSVKVRELYPTKIKEENDDEEEGDEGEDEEVKVPTHTKKELNKAIRKLAAKKAKKSKVMKSQGRAESCKNRKKSRHQKKTGDKRTKHRGGRDTLQQRP